MSHDPPSEMAWRLRGRTGRRVIVWETEARRLRLVQLRLECIRLDDAGRLVRAAGTNPDEIASCSVARFADGFDVLFGAGVDELVVARASGVAPERFFDDTAATAGYVGAGRALRTTRCSTYVFGDPIPAAASVVRRGPEEHVAVHAGRQVAWASSSRSDADAAELWVRTDPEYQRQGYGRAAAAAWAADVTKAGKVPFYSHLDENHASRRLAASLGVRHLFDLVNLTLEPWCSAGGEPGPPPSG